MERDEIIKIPFIEHEAAMFRLERIIKRLCAALILSDVLFAVIIYLIIK